MFMASLHVFTLLLSITDAWICGGVIDKIANLSPDISFCRTSDKRPLRISWVDSQVDFGNTTEIFDISVSRVSNYFKNALKVNQIQSSLSLPGLQSCGTYDPIPENIKTVGIPNADVIIFVNTFYDSMLKYTATAGACAIDPGNLNQVLAGYISINVDEFHNSITDETDLFSILLHETIHILGFSRNLMKYWKTKDGQKYKDLEIMKKLTIRGIPKNVLVTPASIKAAQTHTGCESYPGVELEESEEPLIANNHIDGFFSINDLMSYSITLMSYPSIYVGAILEDTGYYQVNNEYIFDPPWQRKVGCAFNKTRCIESNKSNYVEIVCDSSDTKSCDASLVFKSKCNKESNIGTVKGYYQYFTNKNGVLILEGGHPHSDYCPIFESLEDGNCWGTGEPTFLTSGYGEQTGPNSACIMSTIFQYPGQNADRHPGCFKIMNCSDTGTKIQVGDTTVTCPIQGGEIQIPGYSGKLECPPANKLCKDRPCYRSCLGQGRCIMGRCKCNPGFSGYDCSIICDSSCESCISSLASGCLTCLKENQVPSQNGCVCSKNFYEDEMGNCVKSVNCSSTCKKCVQGNCVECVKNSIVVGDQCVCTKGFKKNLVSGVCDLCIRGFYLDAGNCEQCLNPCLTCQNKTTCDSCLDGFILTESKCISSSACLESNLGICLKCKNGFFLENGNCTICKLGCNSCTSASLCSSCSGDLVLLNNTCICPNNCQICDQVSFLCKSCKDQYYLSKGLCNKCTDTCKKCDSPSKCTECFGIYQLSLDGGCYCPSSCNKCDLNKFTCLSCNPGFYLSTNQECIACSLPCETCLSSVTCLTCLGSYTLQSNGTCTCSDVCLYCDRSDFTCKSCKPKYYLNSGKCLPCVSPCETCLSSQICINCLFPFVMKAFGECTCQSYCSKCDLNYGCLECFQGFYLSEQECKKCVDPCKICESRDKCYQCIGHYLLDNNGTCKCPECCTCDSDFLLCKTPKPGYFLTSSGCSKCADQCKNCSESSISCTSCKGSLQLVGSECAWPLGCSVLDQTTYFCISCETGYDLDPVTKKCLKCGNGCSCCYNNKCIICSGIFELDSKNECKCPTKICKSCDNLTFMCKECYPQFTLIDGYCKPCNPLCESCNGSIRNCTKCRNSFELVNGMCICPISCSKCDFKLYTCTECKEGYYLFNSTCLKCKSPCKTCNQTETKCLSCYNSYYLSNNLCNCPNNCKTCDSTFFSCTMCLDGYFLSNGTCQACQSPCLNCIGKPTTCTSCKGFTVLEGSSCICSKSCNICDPYTFKCNSTACKEGYYFKDPGCYPCSPTCKTCTKPDSCNSCFNSYQLDKGSCKCPDSCLTCDPINFICRDCNIGYFIRDGRCLKCSPECKTCQERENICLSCQINLKLVDTRCENSDGCLKVDANFKCTACMKGYFLANGLCSTCKYPCVTCETTEDNCKSCADGFTFSNAGKGKCTSQLSCLSVMPLRYECGKCSDEYYLSEGYCIACTPPCKQCSSKDVCLSCVRNYELNSVTGTCNLSPNCIIADPLNFKCQICREGTYLSDGNANNTSDGECHLCISSCKTCSGSPNRCTSCFSSFVVNNRDQCCDHGCSFCLLGSKRCMECSDKYYLSNGECRPCDSTCKSCTSGGCTSCLGIFILENMICRCPNECKLFDDNYFCSSCIDGYFLDKGSCNPCSKNCLTCTGKTTCTQCQKGFFYSQNSCNSCSLGCSNCTSSTSCDVCNNAFFMNKKACTACPKGCLNCLSSTSCTLCEDAYILGSGSCKLKPRYLWSQKNESKCHEGCDKCSDFESCDVCFKGFWNDKNVCRPCSKGCITCDNSFFCEICDVGFFINSWGICEECTEGCQKCEVDRYCDICHSGWFLNQGICFKCEKGCRNCDDFNQCLECHSGYSMTEGICIISSI